MASSVTPFHISISDERIEDIKRRVRNYPWQAITSFNDGWEQDPPPDYMQSLCTYWASSYDWRAREKLINSLPHYTAQVGGLKLHFIHEIGSGPNPRPLLLLHGWPYSFHSFSPILERLAHPECFGGQVEDAFTCIVPSLPGYDFSEAPQKPMGPHAVSRAMHILMTSVLGYSEYMSHGGDWGAFVSEWLAFDHPETCIGLHVNMLEIRHHGNPPRFGEYPPDASDTEKDFVAKKKEIWSGEGAYASLHGTKPLKLAYAMLDSPVGIAAWILEAFYAWSDSSGSRRFEDVFDRDELLDNAMLYIVTNSFNTATWIYVGDFEENQWTLPEGKKIEVPTSVLALPDPVFPMVPREIAERSHNVVRYTKGKEGGHFPCYEVGDLLVEDLIGFAKQIRE